MLTDGLIWLSKATATQVYYLTIWLLNSVLIPAAPYLVALAVVASVRLVSILPSRRRPHHHQLRNGIHTRKNIAAVLGSGGHTSELLTLLSHLDENNDDEKAPRRPHTYFVSSGDELSEQKARRFEVARSSSTHPRVITLPRARRVHQSLLTAPFTVIQSFAACWYYINLDESTQLDLIIMNGPATCVPLVAAVYYRRFFGLPSPKLLYVESFARVKTLSLTAKILRHFVDRFIVQWPQGNIEHHGWLV